MGLGDVLEGERGEGVRRSKRRRWEIEEKTERESEERGENDRASV